MTSEPQMQLLEIATLSTSLTTTEIRSEMKWSGSVMSDSVTTWTVAYQPPPIHGIFQARIVEWFAISFSRRSSQPRDWTQVSLIVGRCFTVLSHQGTIERNGPQIKSRFPKYLFFFLASYHLGIIYGQLIYNTNVLAYTYDQDRGRKGS